MDEKFEKQRREDIEKQGQDEEIKRLSRDWFVKAAGHNYSYNFNWMGRPIIQFPQDIIACQEIIWETRPDLVIETGIARGGSLIFWASMMHLLDQGGKVIGVDIDIREHNRQEIVEHPMNRYIRMVEGSSIEEETVDKVRELAKPHKRVMVVLDSMHTHDHVMRELELYSPFVTPGNYLVVFDSMVEFMPDDFYSDRPWGKGNNPYTAVTEFLRQNGRFVQDRVMEDKLLITSSPGGFLKCVDQGVDEHHQG